MLNKLSLQIKLTLLTGCIIILVTTCLTGISIGNFGYSFSIAPIPALSVTPVGGKDINGSLNEKAPSHDGRMAALEKAKQDFAARSIIWMMLIMIIGIGMVYFILGKALKPMTTLNTMIKGINEHNLSTKIIISSKDEVGSLAESFNIMLDRLNRSFENQKQFAANAAHELKTPLTTIKAGIQVLKMDEAPSVNDYKENIDITEQSTERLIKVVDDLLNLNSTKNEHFADEIALQEVIEDILNELSIFIDERNIAVSFENCEHTFIGNKSLIHRALYNLIENAVKYNGSGGRIQINSEMIETVILIHISDTGMGIADDELPNIFEPFYRVDKSRSREIAGSGLGLAIVKSIVEKHKGQVRVRSEQGVGTTFSLQFSSNDSDLG
ncbi:HAMP domain-containing sensor histidine kinase [Paenibacillus glucanolyticus]|uniref:HAMP domain-containing sensor histidine kinase n=1 Tax=Paenibacillus glucanolyticus TaxID=59843 RepID=UPI003674B12F